MRRLLEANALGLKDFELGESPLDCAVLRKEFAVFKVLLEFCAKMLELENELECRCIYKHLLKTLELCLEIRWAEAIELLFELFGDPLLRNWKQEHEENYAKILDEFYLAVESGLQAFRKPSVEALGWSLINSLSFLAPFWKTSSIWEPNLAKEILRCVAFIKPKANSNSVS